MLSIVSDLSAKLQAAQGGARAVAQLGNSDQRLQAGEIHR
jgi:hypothetical protein